MAARLTPCGYFLVATVALAALLIAVGHSLKGQSTPNGELPFWFEVTTCALEQATGAAVGGRKFNVYSIDGGGECGGDGDQRMTLTAKDGLRAGGLYFPVILLQSESYATLAYSIVDGDGKVVTPTTLLELGPQHLEGGSFSGRTDYPWRYSSWPPAAPPAARKLAEAGSAQRAGAADLWLDLSGWEEEEVETGAQGKTEEEEGVVAGEEGVIAEQQRMQYSKACLNSESV